MRPRWDLSDLGWALAMMGAITLVVSTVVPRTAALAVIVAGCALGASGAASYGLGRLRSRRGRRPGS